MTADELLALAHIKEIRAENNDHWMAILALALEHAPEQTRALLRQIAEADGQVRRLTKRIADA